MFTNRLSSFIAYFTFLEARRESLVVTPTTDVDRRMHLAVSHLLPVLLSTLVKMKVVGSAVGLVDELTLKRKARVLVYSTINRSLLLLEQLVQQLQADKVSPMKTARSG